MYRPACLSCLLYTGILVLAGCRMGVPIHVWQPPQLQSTVGKRVVISALAGPKEIADEVKQKLLASAPRDTGRRTTLVDSASLKGISAVQLVSATDDEPNDLVLASLAGPQGFDYILRGEVIQDRYSNQQTDQDKNLKISWRLTALGEQPPAGGRPVVVDVDSAIDRYPDLALIGDQDKILSSAAVRDTFRLFTPSIRRQRVQLAIPYLMLGSKEVRRGNIMALAGRWGEAESIWREVLGKHPAQVSAIHNLALAAVAGQDFSRAKQLSRKAIRFQPTPLHKRTLVWIEITQRDYHKSFRLPDPPEGWFVTSQTPE